MSKPTWLNREKSTREKSGGQEKKLAKQFGGRTTSNSGATFHENDVKTPDFEIEAKITESKQFIIKSATLKEMNRKCKFEKTALLIVEFSNENEEIVILRKLDFFNLIKNTF